MQVHVVFEFNGIKPASPEEDSIVDAINNDSETMRIAFDAQDCWVDDVTYHGGTE